MAAARQEREIMKRVSHKNIINLIDSYEDSNLLYLAMDLMTDDLRNIMISAGRPFKELLARKVFQ